MYQGLRQVLSRLLMVTAVVMGLGACGGIGHTPTRGVYLLVDTSGSYVHEFDKAQTIIGYLLANLKPGDSLAVARIGTASFNEKDIVAKATFSGRPSEANRQKRHFVEQTRKFFKTARATAYTDITGGMLQAVSWLNEENPDHKIILIFSDMKQEIPKNYVRNIDFHMAGFKVVALNVTKLRSDNVDPRKYMNRLSRWSKRVKKGGGRWQVINNMAHLKDILPE